MVKAVSKFIVSLEICFVRIKTKEKKFHVEFVTIAFLLMFLYYVSFNGMYIS